MTTLSASESRDNIQVWFGDVPIANYSAEPALAARYANAMRRRFPSLRVTRSPITTQAEAEERSE